MGRMGGGRLPASRTGPVHTSSDSQSSADSLDPFLNPAPVLDGILNPGITTTPATARRLSLSPPPQRRPTARQIQDAKKINDSTAAAAEEEEDMNRFARGLPTLVVPTLLGDTKDQKSRRRTGSGSFSHYILLISFTYSPSGFTFSQQPHLCEQRQRPRTSNAGINRVRNSRRDRRPRSNFGQQHPLRQHRSTRSRRLGRHSFHSIPRSRLARIQPTCRVLHRLVLDLAARLHLHPHSRSSGPWN
jgi:hypothetical protein